ncbi:uncharacterized protein LOC127808810 isoform X2 [Diospyros lotus]|uniref:uncharacterized protein LOC127808810 isoform X2 n=1 Tax=Diospyros lotus TaxID=55363 RepID=UPI00225875DE|nr:uncharacterized protein LOC127808810 isoform X2 [Diospyros lotus]
MKTNSPLSRRIVRAFLGFLNSVEPAPGVDLEGLEVAKECLAEVFKIDLSSVNTSVNSDGDAALLTNIFSSRETSEKQENNSIISHDALPVDAPSTSSAENASDVNHSEASQTLVGAEEVHTLGVSEDELFGQFFGALEKNHYFKLMPDGHDDQVQLDRATHLFHNAVMELKKSGCQTLDWKNLSEIFKSQGNRAMQSKLYPDAIELYTLAIALSEENAVYYCNRAAAYTQINQYEEAIRDCLKSIEINPNYSKAYSRLGFVYYAQGNYRDAINKGFMKALQLDPNNDSVKENIRVAKQKLNEEMRRTEHDQGSSSTSQESNHQESGEGSRSHAMPPSFTSMPFNTSGLPADIANMVMNMAANVYQGQSSRGGQEAANNADTFAEPEIGISGSMNVNFGEQMMPEDLSGALRSVMEMFSGVPPPVNQQDNANGGSAPS